MHEGSCHCGAVRLTLPSTPTVATACNCSLCRRVGALWAYYRPEQVTLVVGAGTTVPYVQGERTLEMHHCATCGCVTHWQSLKKDRVGVNARMINPAEIAEIPVRRLDGAST